MGRNDDALAVLREVLLAAPQDYGAQLEFAELTPDRAAAEASARAVYDNAEDPDLTRRAATTLGLPAPDLDAPVPLDYVAPGLRLVLIPLPPCDLRLIREAAALYEKSFAIPVSIARLRVFWDWGTPDRIYNERQIQALLIKAAGAQVDFAGWTRERYAIALSGLAAKTDAAGRFNLEQFIAATPSRPGQYRADSRVANLGSIVAPYQNREAHTMYVGVTAANIFINDSNYVFSTYQRDPSGTVAILSYAMMTAKTLNQPIESRPRLVARLAKELVPAGFNQLGLPRPADPSDPFSYASGLDRLDQKTLTLSAPTISALEPLR